MEFHNAWRAFSHGFEIFLEKATLLFDFSTLAGEASTAVPLTLLNDEGEVEQVDLGDVDPIDAFVGELQYAVEAIDWETEPTAFIRYWRARCATALL